MSPALPEGGQLPLALAARPAPRLEDFVEAGNEEVLGALRALDGAVEPAPVLVWGAAGAGKSHLLAGLAAHWTGRGRAAGCLALDAPGLEPAAFEGLERCELLCLDALERVVGARAWEEALFHLYNRLRAEGRALVVASAQPPRALGFVLPDLASRLVSGLVMQLRVLDDAGKLAMLERRARASGLDLPTDVGHWLLTRLPRDTGALLSALERLDWASLAAGRRLTVPFVRAVLEARRPG